MSIPKLEDYPHCDGISSLHIDNNYYYYKCVECKEEFTTTELDDLTLNNIKKEKNDNTN